MGSLVGVGHSTGKTPLAVASESIISDADLYSLRGADGVQVRCPLLAGNNEPASTWYKCTS